MMRLALALQIATLVYHQATSLFDFFPFNGARFYSRKEKLGDAGSGFVMLALPIVGYAWRIPWLMQLGAGIYFFLLAMFCAVWWIPYFFGGSPQWTEIYARVQGRTLSCLPRRGDHPTPNVEHLILAALGLLTGIVTFAAYRSLPGASFRGWPIAALLGSVMFVGNAKAHSRLRWPFGGTPKARN